MKTGLLLCKRQLLLCFLLITIPKCITDRQFVIRGLEGFIPCSYEPEPTNPTVNRLMCTEEATAEFNSQLPIIKSDNVAIKAVIISGNIRIKKCPRDAFVSANAVQTWRSAEHLSGLVRTLMIKETHLVEIEPACLKGLHGLRELRIRNAVGGEFAPNTKHFVNSLFSEFKELQQLETLQLENVDLSSGIQQHYFDRWSARLSKIKLVKNHLADIHDDAFTSADGNSTNIAITELRIEKQQYGWKLLRNSRKWARSFKYLKLVSFDGSTMEVPEGEETVTIDFGEDINRKIRKLSLIGCGLRNVVARDSMHTSIGLSLAPLAPYVEELFLDNNDLQLMNKDFLYGLRNMTNLRLLSLKYNRNPLQMLPTWFGVSGNIPNLRELQLSRTGLAYLRAGGLPRQLKVLHISENPLRQIDLGWTVGDDGFHSNLQELYLNSIRLGSVNIGGNQADWASAFQPLSNSLIVLSLSGCQLEPFMLEPTVTSIKINDANTIATTTITTTNRIKRVVQRQSSYRNNIRIGLDQLSQLQTLILSNNYLTEIPNGAFSGMLQLQNLALAKNGLRTVETPDVTMLNNTNILSTTTAPGHGRNRQRLQRLDLRSNQLTALHRCKPALGFQEALEDLLPLRPQWIKGEQQVSATDKWNDEVAVGETNKEPATEWLGGLSLNDNPLKCDCRLAWLRHYVEKMDKRIKREHMSDNLPRGYISYRREAIDFICPSDGIWSGRQFLSLKANDLHAADHEECRNHPDVFGSAAQSDNQLKSCSDISDHEEHNTRKLHMAPARNRDLQRFKMLEEQPQSEQPHHGLSTEAVVMICVAAVVTLCFLILCAMIMFWLCIHMKRSSKPVTRRMSHTSQSSRISCYTCFRCHSRRKDSVDITTTARIKSIDSTDAYTLYEEPTELGDRFTIVSDSDSLPVKKREDRRARIARKGSKRRPSEAGNSIITNTSQSTILPSSVCSGCSKEEPHHNTMKDQVQQRQPLLPWNDTRLHPVQETIVGASDLQILHQTSRRLFIGGSNTTYTPPPIPRIPLPPVPAPRKTKSTVDLLTTNMEDVAARRRRYGVVVGSPHTASFTAEDPTEYAGHQTVFRRRHHSEGLPSYRIHVENQYDQQHTNNIDIGQLRQTISDPVNIHDRQVIIQWFLTNSDGFHPATSPVANRRRTLLPVSSHRDRSNNFLQASRRTIRQSIDRLRNVVKVTRRSCTSPCKTDGKRNGLREPGDVSLDEQHSDDIYNKIHYRGPSLPIPQFPSPEVEVSTNTQRPPSGGEYLQMGIESENTAIRRPQTDYIKDEYVTELPETSANKQSVRYRRLPSLHCKSLQLDRNLYTLTLDGESPAVPNTPNTQTKEDPDAPTGLAPVSPGVLELQKEPTAIKSLKPVPPYLAPQAPTEVNFKDTGVCIQRTTADVIPPPIAPKPNHLRKLVNRQPV